MDIEAVKRIPILDYLSTKGFKYRVSGNKAIVSASWDRSDSEPSVSVNLTNNTFYDFGKGKGGSIIDLVSYVEGCTVSEAIFALKRGNFATGAFSETKQEPQYELLSVHDELTTSLAEYLHSRCISKEVYSKYVKRIHYFSKKLKRELYGIGFQNDLGGWEIRTRTHKSSITPKTITTIEGGHNVSVFEGFIDFMSACEFYRKSPTNTVVVLNSTANAAKVDWSRYRRAFLFLDNDKSGSEATTFISNNIDSVDMRFYESDFNDHLQKICF
jgi:DNA primase